MISVFFIVIEIEIEVEVEVEVEVKVKFKIYGETISLHSPQNGLMEMDRFWVSQPLLILTRYELLATEGALNDNCCGLLESILKLLAFAPALGEGKILHV